MRKIKFLAFYFCCFCSLGTEHASLSNETKEFASLSNERNETNLLAPLTLLLFYFFCFNLLSFFFFSPLGLLVKKGQKIKTEKILGASQNVFSSQKTSLDNFNLSRSTEKRRNVIYLVILGNNFIDAHCTCSTITYTLYKN